MLINTGGVILNILDPTTPFWLQFAGPPQQVYRLETTNQLAPPHWQFQGTVSVDAFGHAYFKDSSPAGFQRYYRVVVP